MSCIESNELEVYIEQLLNEPRVCQILYFDFREQIRRIIPESLHSTLWESVLYPNLFDIIMDNEDYEMVCSDYIYYVRNFVMESSELELEVYHAWFDSEIEYLQTKLPDDVLTEKDMFLEKTVEFAIPVIISELSYQEVRDSIIFILIEHREDDFKHYMLRMGENELVLKTNPFHLSRDPLEMLNWYMAKERQNIASIAGEIPRVTDQQKMLESCRDIAAIIALAEGMEVDAYLEKLFQENENPDIIVSYNIVMELAAPYFLSESPA